MTNQYNTVLYTGVTNNLERRSHEHHLGAQRSFSQKYRVNKLVYVETFNNINDAIAREKQIKGGSRKKKIDLIDSVNPLWKNLFEE